MKYNIIIVGCGGTGGNYVQDLGRYLYENPLQSQCRILIADGDVVEEKNIGRQPFQRRDIGRKKAEVMQEVLTEVFGLKCDFYPEFITSKKDLEKFELRNAIPIIVGCVDNHACRRVMHEYFESTPTIYYLDSANEEYIGEVVVGMRMSNNEICPDRAHYFPEILNNSSPHKNELSCLERSEENPQHYVTNRTAANLLLKSTIDILEEQGWKGGIYYFNIREGRTEFQEKVTE